MFAPIPTPTVQTGWNWVLSLNFSFFINLPMWGAKEIRELLNRWWAQELCESMQQQYQAMAQMQSQPDVMCVTERSAVLGLWPDMLDAFSLARKGSVVMQLGGQLAGRMELVDAQNGRRDEICGWTERVH